MLNKSQLYFQFSRRPFKFVQIQPLFVFIFSVSVTFDINWEDNGGLEQIWRAHVKIENIAEIYSARMDSSFLTHHTKFWHCIHSILKGQSIIIPEEVVTVPKTFIFGPETILPNNGILLFDQTGKLGMVIISILKLSIRNWITQFIFFFQNM